MIPRIPRIFFFQNRLDLYFFVGFVFKIFNKKLESTLIDLKDKFFKYRIFFKLYCYYGYFFLNSK